MDQFLALIITDGRLEIGERACAPYTGGQRGIECASRTSTVSEVIVAGAQRTTG